MVDSCVLIDVFSRDPVWYDWSAAAISDAADRGSIVINPVIYSEISVRFSSIEELNAHLPRSIYVYQSIPQEAAFLAGKCFLAYRKRQGSAKLHPLPDFFIGAHAAVSGLPLITRDPKRFRQFFPRLELVCP